MIDSNTSPSPFSLPVFSTLRDYVQSYRDLPVDAEGLPDGLFSDDEFKSMVPVEDDVFVWRYAKFQDYCTRSGNYGLLSEANRKGGYCDLTMSIMSRWSVYRTLGNPGYQRQLVIELDDIRCRDSNTYHPLALAVELLSDPMLSLVTKEVSPIDFDYGQHIYLSKKFGLGRHFTDSEKSSMNPFSVGSIVVVHTKSGQLTETFPWGKISSSKLCEVTDITPDGMYMRSLNITGTLEDRVTDFLRITPDHRSRFTDLLFPQEVGEPVFYSFEDIGLNLAMFTEPYLVTGLSSSLLETQTSMITHSGFLYPANFCEVDLVYWCLKQRNISFDEELFFKDNSPFTQEDMSWNRIGEVLPKEMLDRARVLASHPELEEAEEFFSPDLDFRIDK